MRIGTIFLAVALAFSPMAFAISSHGGGHGSHSSSHKSGQSTHVKGYIRKDGTYVRPHERRTSGTVSASERHYYRKNYVAEGYTLHSSVQRDSHGGIKRSAAAKDAFKRQHPCPANGRSTGACPGYVIDHVKALECGGADDPSNMQWQTTAAAKAKDKTERHCRL